ncbi:DUF4350 domain-containing protein [Rossellomorea marisflavi]|uniref:DUF4350 domain-containing protein n=1 Tax=Rossellomorea marisflavi TaxID=189381 RepID=UPI00203B16FD|nr:DUF4350 domain-containing protein [Rossellomorea marisflavi]MCM2587690.1 DUF4350 domain-containing protein [Rossellomorea marisflavi]
MKRLSNLKGWIGFAVAIAVFLTAGVLLSGDKPKDYKPFLSESPSPTGTKALYTYLGQEAPEVSRWELPSDRLPDGSDQLLIMIEPFSFPTQEEIQGYEDFMERGNTILLIKEDPDGLFGIETEYTDQFTNNVSLGQRLFRTGELSNVRILPEDDVVLLSDREGAVATKREFGNGELIVSTNPQWFINNTILKKEHLPILLTLLREAGADDKEAILFDEYYHYGTSGLRDVLVYPQWMLIIMLQVIILTILWLWLKGKRFGSIETVREETVRFSDERIRALGSWYIRRKLYKESLQMQADYVRQSLQDRWGIPTSKDWPDIQVSLKRRVKLLPDKKIMAITEGLPVVLQRARLDQVEYVKWSQAIDELRKEVEDL